MSTEERHRLIVEFQGFTDLAEERLEKRIWGVTDFKNPGMGRYLGVQDLVRKFDSVSHLAGKPPNGWTMALLEMLVDPVLVAWVPGWIVEQYERQNDYFRGSVRWALKEKRAHKIGTNKTLLRRVLRRMLKKAERKEEQDAGSSSDGAGKAGQESGRESSSHASDVEPGAAADRPELIRDERPDEDEVAGVEGADGGWNAVTVAQRLSAAAGSAAPAADVNVDEGGGGEPADSSDKQWVNPSWATWNSLVDAAEYQRMKALWTEIQGGDVETTDEDKVVRSELDPWQAFAHDVSLASLRERQRRLRERGCGAKFDGFQPLRLLLSGGAGTGKSRCVRAIVSSMRHELGCGLRSGRCEQELRAWGSYWLRCFPDEAWRGYGSQNLWHRSRFLRGAWCGQVEEDAEAVLSYVPRGAGRVQHVGEKVSWTDFVQNEPDPGRSAGAFRRGVHFWRVGRDLGGARGSGQAHRGRERLQAWEVYGQSCSHGKGRRALVPQR